MPTRKRFYMQCVQYVKKRQGYIHPRDTSYINLVKKLEYYAGIEKGKGNPLERCKFAALKLDIFQASHRSLFSTRQKTTTIVFRKDRRDFYASFEWKRLRYQTLKKYGARCQCCGASGEEVSIQIDHIKPISKHWGLRFDPDNLQVLCGDCNFGKLNSDETDWR